jgi:O-antigen/teichoic acid export membrane protein
MLVIATFLIVAAVGLGVFGWIYGSQDEEAHVVLTAMSAAGLCMGVVLAIAGKLWQRGAAKEQQAA